MSDDEGVAVDFACSLTLRYELGSMAEEERVFFNCGDIKLEGLLCCSQSADAVKGAVLCHPHPLYGGDMRNSVVWAVAKGLIREGFTTLRFNFRGTGSSEGRHDQGDLEVQDVAAAVSCIVDSGAGHGDRLALVAYSFGAWVGARAVVNDPRVGRIILIAPPASFYDFGFLAQDSYTRPLMFIAGEKDEFCSIEVLEKLAAGLDNCSLRSIEGADHFFLGNEGHVAEAVVQFLTEGGE